MLKLRLLFPPAKDHKVAATLLLPSDTRDKYFRLTKSVAKIFYNEKSTKPNASGSIPYLLRLGSRT